MIQGIKTNKGYEHSNDQKNSIRDKKVEANTTLIEPLGLHLFGYIIDILDNMKTKIDCEVDKLKGNKPHIDTKYLSETINEVFISSKYSEEKKKNIEDMYNLS